MTVERHERAVRRVAMAMMALAAAALGGALGAPGRFPLPLLWEGWGLVAAPGSLAACRLGPPRLAALMPLAMFARPFVAAAFALAVGGRAPMPEIVLVAALQDLGLALAMRQRPPAAARLAALVSLFLLLVAATTGEGHVLLGLLVGYAILGTGWLMLVSWAGSARGADLPPSAAAWVLGVVAAVAAAAAVGPSRAATALAGLVPTSGGTGRADPEARGGVNDGDAEVAASEAPRSIGFTKSDVYLDSERPSLFDTFNETYGEPYKPKSLERMIAVAPDKVIEQRDRPAENLRAGREFPLLRRPPGQPPARPGSRAAEALVYIDGPTPAHLRLATFDRFDGRTWREEDPGAGAGRPEPARDGGWLLLKGSAAPIFTSTVRHRMKIGTLDTSILPVPPT